jgi:hypothetical protein
MNTEGKITVSILSFYRDPDFVFYDALETTMFAYRLVKDRSWTTLILEPINEQFRTDRATQCKKS